jgi:hypothetical protein
LNETCATSFAPFDGAAAPGPLTLIACHDQPDLGPEVGEDVAMLPVPFAPETDVRLADKIRKRRFIGAWLRSNLDENGVYVMFLDADDLVHGDLAAYVLADHNRRSYLVTQSYRLDCRSGLLDRRSKGFHCVCASSFIGYFRKDELPQSWEDTDAAFARFGSYPPVGHEDYDRLAIELGKAPDAIPFHAVIYTMNHGESLRSHKIANKIREPDVRHLVLPGRARQILVQDFGFNGRGHEASAVAGPGRFARSVLNAGIQKICRKLVRV